MKSKHVMKVLTVGVVVLFFGTGITPIINANVNKISDSETELVEIITEVYGINVAKHSIQLTKEDAFVLENIVNNFKVKLYNSETRDDTLKIFSETVEKLDIYGLLPNGIDIQEVQEIVSGSLLNQEYMKLRESDYFTNQENDDTNSFCLIAGMSDDTLSASFATIPRLFFFISLGYILDFIVQRSPFLQHLLENFGIDWFDWLIGTSLLMLFLPFAMPLEIGGILTFGSETYDMFGGPTSYHPAEGWVTTIGLNGYKTWNDSFYGQSFKIPIFYTSLYVGAIGFTGIKIYTKTLGTVFLGSVIRVKLGSNHP